MSRWFPSREGCFDEKARFVAIFFTKRDRIEIIVSMTARGNPSEKDGIGPFYPEFLDQEGLRLIDTSEEAERTDEGFDKKKKKDNCWHNFKTP